VIESLRCPGCATHYGLRRERVGPVHKRAKCFRCGEVFGIEAQVLQLLGQMEAPSQNAAEPYADLIGIEAGDLDLPAFTAEAIPEPQFLQEVMDAPEDIPVSPVSDSPSLSMGDLDIAEEEILEETVTPEPVEEAPSTTEDGTSGFASAKDAISKILGGLQAPQQTQNMPTRLSQRQDVDMEATLSAFDKTLSNTAPESLAPPIQEQGETASTVRLSRNEIQAAMGAMPIPEAQPPIMPPPQENSRFGSMNEAPLSPDQDPNLLKVRVGTEVYSNLTQEQLSSWIEEGRILETHPVARQFSDHWIEAAKVPSLRPTFERLRRLRSEAAPTMASETGAHQKRSLFGGLFGRNG
jgi:predicted Zn finger-like uncharacterized protein